jgi:TRAP-type C4-dicarboxylate transport system permease large subunit
VTPIISGLNLSLMWFGVLYVVLAEVGFVTPPFGLNLFAINGVLPQHSSLTIARGALPFVIPMIIMIIILIAFPQLTLWLPNIMY